MTEPNEPFLGYYPEAELVFALVCPLGAEHSPVVDTLKNYLAQFGYETNPIRLSDLFGDLLRKLGRPPSPPTAIAELAKYKIDAGNLIRELTKTNDILARVAAGLIANRRAEEHGQEPNAEESPEKWKRPLSRTAHLVSTLKRPEEVKTLRRIYGSGFF